jgi:hypothetical protein
MPNKVRTARPRFGIGQTVLVGDSIMSAHIGETGSVIRIHSSPQGRTLDKYVVQFSSGIEKTFWDIQLKKISN